METTLRRAFVRVVDFVGEDVGAVGVGMTFVETNECRNALSCARPINLALAEHNFGVGHFLL